MCRYIRRRIYIYIICSQTRMQLGMLQCYTWQTLSKSQKIPIFDPNHWGTLESSAHILVLWCIRHARRRCKTMCSLGIGTVYPAPRTLLLKCGKESNKITSSRQKQGAFVWFHDISMFPHVPPFQDLPSQISEGRLLSQNSGSRIPCNVSPMQLIN